MFTLWPFTWCSFHHISPSLLYHSLLPQRPPSDAVWKIQLCLTVPEGSDLLEIASPNNSAVIFRGKLLLFVSTLCHHPNYFFISSCPVSIGASQRWSTSCSPYSARSQEQPHICCSSPAAAAAAARCAASCGPHTETLFI